MALKGSAFLCLWNDFDLARSEEYERWHTLEHVPERVAAPGFLSGRRYSACGRASGRYLTIYDLESLAALETPEYLDLQQNPTPWSARMRKHFIDFQRIPFETIISRGEGCASHIALAAFEAANRDEREPQRLAERLARIHYAGESVAFHVGRALSVPAYGVFGVPAEANTERQKIIAIQETTTAQQAEKLLHDLTQRLEVDHAITHIFRSETTALIYGVNHHDVRERWRRTRTDTEPGRKCCGSEPACAKDTIAWT